MLRGKVGDGIARKLWPSFHYHLGSSLYLRAPPLSSMNEGKYIDSSTWWLELVVIGIYKIIFWLKL